MKKGDFVANGITNSQLYQMLMDLTKESAERDSRTETFSAFLQDEIKELKNSNKEVLSFISDLKKCFEDIKLQIHNISSIQKTQDDKLNRLFDKTDELKRAQKKCDTGFEDQKDLCDDRFKVLEDKQKNVEKPVNTAKNILAKIGTVILTVTVTAVVTYFLTKLGIKG